MEQIVECEKFWYKRFLKVLSIISPTGDINAAYVSKRSCKSNFDLSFQIIFWEKLT